MHALQTYLYADSCVVLSIDAYGLTAAAAQEKLGCREVSQEIWSVLDVLTFFTFLIFLAIFRSFWGVFEPF